MFFAVSSQEKYIQPSWTLPPCASLIGCDI